MRCAQVSNIARARARHTPITAPRGICKKGEVTTEPVAFLLWCQWDGHPCPWVLQWCLQSLHRNRLPTQEEHCKMRDRKAKTTHLQGQASQEWSVRKVRDSLRHTMQRWVAQRKWSQIGCAAPIKGFTSRQGCNAHQRLLAWERKVCAPPSRGLCMPTCADS